MSSVAIFVDAGYLFAQGSAAISGSGKSRQLLKLNETAAIAELARVAAELANGLPLLRVYWYDGARSARILPGDHAALAFMDHVKLRLGFITSRGQQKGVDSLIVTDMIELARNHAMSDAVLLSGDEDVRIGVQIAQSFGVRIHLLGIAPCRGSQSLALMQEADTTTEWDATTVARFLSVMPPFAIATMCTIQVVTNSPATGVPSATSVGMSLAPPGSDAQSGTLGIGAEIVLFRATLAVRELEHIKECWEQGRGLPGYIDGRLLARCRTRIGRDLTAEERRHARANSLRMRLL